MGRKRQRKGSLDHERLEGTRVRVRKARAEQRGEDFIDMEHAEYAEHWRYATRGAKVRPGAATQELHKKTAQRQAVLVEAVKEVGRKYPQYWDGEKFQLEDACMRLLADWYEGDDEKLETRTLKRKAVRLSEEARDRLGRKTLSLRTLLKHTEKALKTWTRADCDEEAAADEELDERLRCVAAERARRAKRTRQV